MKRKSEHRSNYSFVGPEVTVEGNIDSPAELEINGRVKGDVRCASLVQGEGGRIEGNLEAQDVHCAGTIDGNVVALSLTLEASARITGDVDYDTISMAKGARVNGRLKQKEKDEPETKSGLAGAITQAPPTAAAERKGASAAKPAASRRKSAKPELFDQDSVRTAAE
ncbi:MAG: polymer-forming cytoskeletal protein [Sphingomonadaceae bacterium]